MSIRVKYYYGANARIVDKVIIHLQTDRAVTAAKSYFSLNNIKVNDAVIVYKEQYDGFRAANTSLTVQEQEVTTDLLLTTHTLTINSTVTLPTK